MAKQNRTDDAFSTLKAAKEATQKLSESEAALRAQHSALLQEKRDITNSLASEAETIGNLGRLVSEAAAEWTRVHGRGIARDLSGHRDVHPGSTRERFVAPRLPSWGDLQGALRFGDLVGLVPDLVKSRLAEVVRGSGAKFGLPAEARAERMREIETEITSIEGQHEALISGAAEVGIVYPLLDAVRERREAEALTTKRAAELAEARSRGEFVASGLSVGGGQLVTGGSVGGRG